MGVCIRSGSASIASWLDFSSAASLATVKSFAAGKGGCACQGAEAKDFPVMRWVLKKINILVA